MTTRRLGYYVDMDHRDESTVDIMNDDWFVFVYPFKIKQSRRNAV